MRTKVLCAAALAAGALTSMAQVYSANVVGYVNVTLEQNKYTMICNPLDATMGGTVAGANNIKNLFGSVATDGDYVFRWNAATGDFDADQPMYSTDLNDWTSNFDANPGEGIWYIRSGPSTTVTFVGQVLQGTPAFTFPGNKGATAGMIMQNSYNALGSPVPVGGSFKNAIVGITPTDGDYIFPWNVAAGDWDANQPMYSTDLNDWTSDATINPGIGFVYIRAGASTTWTRNFTVQ